MCHDITVRSAHSFFQADFTRPGAHGSKRSVPDAEAAKHKGGNNAEPEQRLNPHKGHLQARYLIIPGIYLYIRGILAGLHNFRYLRCQPGYVFPAHGTDKQPGNFCIAPFSVAHGCIRNKSAFCPVAQHDAGNNALNLKNILIKEKQLAYGRLRRAKKVYCQITANHADTAVPVYVSLAQWIACHQVRRKTGNKEGIHSVHKGAKSTFACLQVKKPAVAEVAAHKFHTRQAGYAVNALRVEFTDRLPRELSVLHCDVDNIDAAHEHHILAHLITYFLAEHGQGNKGGNAKCNGKDNAIAFLPRNLAQGNTY